MTKKEVYVAWRTYFGRQPHEMLEKLYLIGKGQAVADKPGQKSALGIVRTPTTAQLADRIARSLAARVGKYAEPKLWN